MNIFEQYKETTEENIFRNIKYLDPDCRPNQFKHRDQEIAAIAHNISPIFYGSIPINTVIIGNNATGKTTAMQIVLEQVREALPEVIPIYVNCRKSHTEYSIYREIYYNVIGKEAPERGSNSQKIFTDIMKYLEVTRQPLIIVLDDANYLLGSENRASPHSQNVIRNLCRAKESYNVIIGIYPVISSEQYQYKFDREVSTLFMPSTIKFHPYSTSEVKNIITDRCGYAFNIKIPPAVVDSVVEVVELEANIRLAWELLKWFGLQLMNELVSEDEMLTLMNNIINNKMTKY